MTCAIARFWPWPSSFYDGTVTRLQIGQGLVTASCYAPGTGDIFLGFQDGDVYCFRPSRSEVVRLPGSLSDRVASLATDAQAVLVVVLRDGDPAPTVLTSYLLTAEDEYRVEGRVSLGQANYCLVPLICPISPGHVVGMWNEYQLSFLRGALLAAWGSLHNPAEGIDLCSALLLPVTGWPHLDMRILLFAPNYVRYCEKPRRERHHWTAHRWWHGNLGWTPCIPEGSSLRSVPIAWLQSEKSHLELVGLTSTGTLHWSLLDVGRAQAADEVQSEIRMLAHNSAVRPEGYRAATLLGPGQVAGVSRSHIDWLRAGSREIAHRSVTKVDLHTAVACFPSYGTRELIVVCSDGEVVRVAIPS
jgi:hypothetical protein